MVDTKCIWIIEDDPAVLFTYREIFRDRFEIRTFDSLGGFEAALKQRDPPLPDFLIADLSLPDGNFLDHLLQKSQPQAIDFPFLVISSCAEEETLHACFDEGAIDYLTKPFTRGELLAKVSRYLESAEHSLRRPRLTEPVRGLQIDFKTMEAESDEGLRVSLTPKELQILSFIESSPDRSASRARIIDRIWRATRVSTKTFDVHLFNLRRKLHAIGWMLRFEDPDLYRLRPTPPQGQT